MSTDELTIGQRWRGSRAGKAVKDLITSDNTKRIRDKALNALGEDREHIKRFAQYLTGGTVGNKDITDLPAGVRRDIIAAHRMQDYPNRRLKIPNPKNPEFESIDNPNYNPRDTLLSTYGTKHKYNLDGKLDGGTSRTSGSIGHGEFTKDKDGNYTLTDTWDVDEASSFKNDPHYHDKRDQLKYRPWISKSHPDLREGKWMAARAYDISKFLGINKNLNYNVKFKGSNVDKNYKNK